MTGAASGCSNATCLAAFRLNAAMKLKGKLAAVKSASKRKPKHSSLKKPAAKYGYKVKQNSSFKKQHGLKYSRSSVEEKTTGTERMSRGLRDVSMPPFSDILKLNEKSCKKFLQQYDVVLSDKATPTFTCWHCGEVMRFTPDKDLFRCVKKSCQKSRVQNSSVCYTPLHQFYKGGADADWQMVLRCAYGLGCKVSNDSAAHLLRRPDESWQSCHWRVGRLYSCMKVALAWQENRFICFSL